MNDLREQVNADLTAARPARQAGGDGVSVVQPATAVTSTWRAYLYVRANPADWTDETWLHRSGCRRYLTVERHTVTNEVRGVREASRPGGPSGVHPRAGEPPAADRAGGPA